MDVWESFTWEVTDIEERGELIVAFLESTGKARGSGLELDRSSAMVWRVDKGRAMSLTFYRDPADAVAAARP
jgi:ketosteroid isomerase-like protein